MPAQILPAAEIGATMDNHRRRHRVERASYLGCAADFHPFLFDPSENPIRRKMNGEIMEESERSGLERGGRWMMIQARDIPDDAWRHISDSSALPLRVARN